LWPGKDALSLSKTVVGVADMRLMPPGWLTLLVAALLLVAGLAPLVKAGLLPAVLSAAWTQLCLGVLAAVFGLRGLAAYVPNWRRKPRVEPFATLDRRCYGPLCLCLSVGFWLVWSHQ